MVGVMVPSVFAEHAEVTIVTVEGSVTPDCSNDGCYFPLNAIIDVGGVVTMKNTDPTGMHTFTSGTIDSNGTPFPDGVFDTGVQASGETFEWIPTQTGEQPYYCMLHTWMRGTITVQESGTTVQNIPITENNPTKDSLTTIHPSTNPDIYFSSSFGGLDSTCMGLTYQMQGIIQSDTPSPFKIKIINPNGNPVGQYDGIAGERFEVAIDIDYHVDDYPEGQYLIHIHYNGNIYEKSYGWNKQSLPTREAQIQCLVATEINKSLEFRSMSINLGSDIGVTTRDSKNMEFIKNVVGEEKFIELEPIISIDSVVKQRQGEYRIETNYAKEQIEILRLMLNDYVDVIEKQNFENYKNIVSNMELSTEEKTDVIYDRKLNNDETKKWAKYQNNKFSEQLVNLYLNLDHKDASQKLAKQLELERQMKEELDKEKIRQELESETKFKNQIRKELEGTLGIASFVDQTKDPQHYIDRYNNEPAYKQWFDDNYSQYSSIYQAVGMEKTAVEPILEPVVEPVVEPIVEQKIISNSEREQMMSLMYQGLAIANVDLTNL